MPKNSTRLKAEYEAIKGLKDQSELVKVVEVENADAVDGYRVLYKINYKCEGITRISKEHGDPICSADHMLEVDLTEFPDRGPRMRFLTPVWHPGVAADDTRCVDIKPAGLRWEDKGSVLAAIIWVGRMLQYKEYEHWLSTPVTAKNKFASVKNKNAVNWLKNRAVPEGIVGPDSPIDNRELILGEDEMFRRDSDTSPAAESAPPTAGSGETKVEPGAPAAASAAVANGGEPPAAGAAAVEADPEETQITRRGPHHSGGGGTDASAAAAAGAKVTPPETKQALAEPKPDAVGSEPGGVERAAAAAGANVATSGEVKVTTKGGRRIIFGDPIRTEVRTEPFPYQRLMHWKPVGQKYDVKEPSYSIIVTQEVLATVNNHVSQSMKKELGGFLFGNRYYCPNSRTDYIRIDLCAAARFASSDHVSMQLVDETFLAVIEERQNKYQGKDIVGWYHSHPDMDVFLSPNDIKVHQSRFSEAWALALVIDPKKKTGGFFCWRDGELHPHARADFYELREPQSKTTYVPWVNYECFDAQNGEPRTPLLAEGAMQGGVVFEDKGGVAAWLSRRVWYLGAAALVALLGLWGLMRGGWVGGARTDPSPTPAATPVASVKTSDTPQMDRSPTPSVGSASLVPLTSRHECTYDYVCTLAAKFQARLSGLQVETAPGRLAKFHWKGDEVIIDISRTEAMESLRNSNAPSATLTLFFSEKYNPEARTPFIYTLRAPEVKPDSAREDKALADEAARAAADRAAADRAAEKAAVDRAAAERALDRLADERAAARQRGGRSGGAGTSGGRRTGASSGRTTTPPRDTGVRDPTRGRRNRNN